MDSDASTAKTLVFVALILEVVVFIIGLLGVLLFLAAAAAFSASSGTGNPMSINVGFSFFGLFIFIFFPIAIIWVLLDYFLIYKHLSQGEVAAAESPALILGVIQLVLGGIITGLLLIIAWVKIRDSMRNSKVKGQDRSDLQ